MSTSIVSCRTSIRLQPDVIPGVKDDAAHFFPFPSTAVLTSSTSYSMAGYVFSYKHEQNTDIQSAQVVHSFCWTLSVSYLARFLRQKSVNARLALDIQKMVTDRMQAVRRASCFDSAEHKKTIVYSNIKNNYIT
eukprot:5557813-Amphidinium_carterae.1